MLPALVQVGHLGGGGHDAGGEPGRQRPPHDRQHHGPGPSTGRRRKRGTREQAFGRSRGGFTSKVHMVGDAHGRPLAFHLTPGEAADCQSYDTLSELPAATPAYVLGDKAYDTDAIRADLKPRGIRASATRYDKTAESFLAMLHLGATKIWLKFVHRA